MYVGCQGFGTSRHELQFHGALEFPCIRRLKALQRVGRQPLPRLQLLLRRCRRGTRRPGQGTAPIVEYLSARKKIFNVHFRNIRGKLNDLVEVWPDEGDDPGRH